MGVSQLITFLSFFLLWRYSPNLGLGLPPWNSPFHFGFLDLRHSVGLLGRVISSSQGLYLYTKRNAHIHTSTKHPCPEWDFRGYGVVNFWCYICLFICYLSFVVYVTMLSVIQIIEHQLIGWLMNI
jgi:hypothetical protein